MWCCGRHCGYFTMRRKSRHNHGGCSWMPRDKWLGRGGGDECSLRSGDDQASYTPEGRDSKEMNTVDTFQPSTQLLYLQYVTEPKWGLFLECCAESYKNIAAGQKPYQLIYGFWSNWGCNFKVSETRTGFWCAETNLLSLCLWMEQAAGSGCYEMGPRFRPARLRPSLSQMWGWWEQLFGSVTLMMRGRKHSCPAALSSCSGTWHSLSGIGDNRFSLQQIFFQNKKKRFPHSDLPVQAQWGSETKNMMN